MSHLKIKTNQGARVELRRRFTRLWLNMLLVVAGLSSWVCHAQTNFYLSATNLVVGPLAGVNSVMLDAAPFTAAWTASANATWLHLSSANQSGIGDTNLIFSFDANPGGTRTGTITIGGQTLSITQVGSTYQAVSLLTTLVSNLPGPVGVAVDTAGNVYICDETTNVVKGWSRANNSVATLFSYGNYGNYYITIDGFNNLYVDAGTIGEWKATNGMVTTVANSFDAGDIAVNASGSVLYVNQGEVIFEFNLMTGVTEGGVSFPYTRSVAASFGPYCYIGALFEFEGPGLVLSASFFDDTFNSVVTTGIGDPAAIASDASGNIYIADDGYQAVEKWTLASNSTTTLVTGLSSPEGVAIDASGNVYIADTGHGAIEELAYAFVDTSARIEPGTAGTDTLSPVFPSSVNLSSPFAPTSDQSWLTITGAANGIVNVSFTSNTTPLSRTAHISVLGQTVTIIQPTVYSYALGTPSRLEGSPAGTDSVTLSVSPNSGPWTATPSAPWLHVSNPNQSGTGSGNIVFTFDANTGTTRTGTLAIGSQSLLVTQAGSNYVATSPLTTLSTPGLLYPIGLGVDASGNVYIADTSANAVKKWTPANNNVQTLIGSGLDEPYGLALDASGNVYISSADDTLKEWSPSNSTSATLVSGLNNPQGLAVDTSGNVYIAETGNNAVKKWTATNGYVSTLVSSGLSSPYAVAVDVAGNVYIADTFHSAIKVWNATSGNVSTLLSSGLSYPYGVAVDGAGNVYVADTYNSAIKMWSPTTGGVTVLASAGLSYPSSVEPDANGDIYIADTDNAAIKELPYAFVDTSPKFENLTAGSDILSVLPSTVNLFPPFAPSTDRTWLSINGISNGAVSFGFTSTTTNRTGDVIVLGQTASVMQLALSVSLSTNALTESPNAGADSVLLTVSPPSVGWSAVANAFWLHVNPTNQFGIGTGTIAFNFDTNFGALRTGTIMVAGKTLTITQSGPTYTVTPTNLFVPLAAGTNHVSVSVSPAFGPWTASANASWLHVAAGSQSGTGNTNLTFTYDVNPGTTRTGTLTIAGQTVTVTQAGYIYSLGGAAFWEGPAAGTNTLMLGVSPTGGGGSWSATQNSTWLHISQQDGSGSAQLVLSYDTNTGSTRSGTFTIAGQTVTVTQAGSSYVQAPQTVRQLISNYGLLTPGSITANAAGQVFVSELGHSDILELEGSSFTYIAFVVTANGLVADSAGNAYFANGGLQKWNAGSHSISTLVSSGWNGMLTIDPLTNIYVANGNQIERWAATNGAVTTVISDGSYAVAGIGSDATGTIYYTQYSGSISYLNAYYPAYGYSVTLILTGLGTGANGVAVDAGGNVYIADSKNNAVKLWSALTSSVTTVLGSGLNYPESVAVDGVGNLYISDTGNNAVKEIPRAFVDPTAKTESPAAGTDVLSPVLPTTESLVSPFNPTSDSSWVTIKGATNGAVSFAFTANTSGTNRVAHINLLGQLISVTQLSIPVILTEPKGTTGGSGNPETLAVSAIGSGQLYYQWQVNGTNIGGATASYLNLGSLQFTNAGLYTVVVSNANGAVTSSVAVLNVAPQLSIQVTNHGTTLKWPGPFVLQSSSNLTGPYADLSSAISPYFAATTNAQRFYRLRSVPVGLTATNLKNGGFSVGGPGISGCNFIIESSTNLINWQPLATNPSPFSFTDTNSSHYPWRFYRAVLAH